MSYGFIQIKDWKIAVNVQSMFLPQYQQLFSTSTHSLKSHFCSWIFQFCNIEQFPQTEDLSEESFLFQTYMLQTTHAHTHTKRIWRNP